MNLRPAWNPGPRTRELSNRLVEWDSQTGSAGEAVFGERLAGLLREIPYFQNHPDHVRLVDSHGDPMRRSVIAVVRGKGRRALALAGHYDVVSVENYRELAALAFKPDELLPALIADLKGRPLAAAERRALEDLDSGDFAAGRGMLDMKSGVAAGIAVLEDFAAGADRSGNLILIATPDEERGSRGMRSLRDVLPTIAAEFELDIEAGINLDATSDQGDGAEGRAIYRGTIGKALPFALVIGHSSHAAYPFEGISAQLIASEIIRTVEANPALSDRAAGETSPPPICLEAKDLRAGYEVTTPERVWLAFNWLSHNWTAADLLNLFEQAVRTAANSAIDLFNQRAGAYAATLGKTQAAPVGAAALLSVAELRRQVDQVGGADATARVNALERALQGSDDPLAQTRLVVSAMIAEAGILGPTVIYGFSSLVYPATHIARTGKNQEFAAVLEGARLAHEQSGRGAIMYREYFTGISDMSFLGHRPSDADAAYIAANTPSGDLVDQPRPDALIFPVVNIGPWGREFHQKLERVHAPYAFVELPMFLREIVRRFLGG